MPVSISIVPRPETPSTETAMGAPFQSGTPGVRLRRELDEGHVAGEGGRHAEMHAGAGDDVARAHGAYRPPGSSDTRLTNGFFGELSAVACAAPRSKPMPMKATLRGSGSGRRWSRACSRQLIPVDPQHLHARGGDRRMLTSRRITTSVIQCSPVRDTAAAVVDQPAGPLQRHGGQGRSARPRRRCRQSPVSMPNQRGFAPFSPSPDRRHMMR